MTIGACAKADPVRPDPMKADPMKPRPARVNAAIDAAANTSLRMYPPACFLRNARDQRSSKAFLLLAAPLQRSRPKGHCPLAGVAGKRCCSAKTRSVERFESFFTSPACGGGRIASIDAIRVGEFYPLDRCVLRRHPHPGPPPQAGEGAHFRRRSSLTRSLSSRLRLLAARGAGEFGSQYPRKQRAQESRASDAPAASYAKVESIRVSPPQVHRSKPAFPARMVLTVSFVVSLVIGLS